MMTERDLIKRHQAALRAIDRYDERNAIHAVLAKTGPRTGTHPMATKIEPEVPRPMAMRLRPPLLDMDMDDFSQSHNSMVMDDVINYLAILVTFSAVIAVIAMIAAVALELLP